MSASDQEVPAGTQDEVKTEDNGTINIKVRSSTTCVEESSLDTDLWGKVATQNGEETFFKIKRSTKLSKLQGAYASKVGKDVSSIRFVPLVLRAIYDSRQC